MPGGARRRWLRRALAGAALAAAAAGPGASTALGQGGPLSPLPAPAPAPAPVQTATSTTPSNTTSDSGGLSSAAQIALYALGGVLLLGIGWVIVRDARRAVPDAGAPSAGAAGRKRRYDREKARARAKAARRQRRRNRLVPGSAGRWRAGGGSALRHCYVHRRRAPGRV